MSMYAIDISHVTESVFLKHPIDNRLFSAFPTLRAKSATLYAPE